MKSLFTLLCIFKLADENGVLVAKLITIWMYYNSMITVASINHYC